MIAKKTKSADLEKKRFAFFQIGLIVVGSATLAAFEFSSASVADKVVQLQSQGPDISDEFLTDFEPVTPPPASAIEVPAPVIPDELIVMDDDEIIDEPDFTLINDFVFPVNTKNPIDDVILEEPAHDFADTEPQFPGGELEMMKFIVEHTQYPEIPREMGVQGIVYVGFIVNTDGTIVEVDSRNELNKELEAEAERVIKLMPKWTPGEQAGKKVRVRYVVPINFIIKNG